ncbi:MFS general substrate transporter [Suillus occidentalis]|nr:MFS general substrate transporter [Suillus occidentalis]
MSLSSTTVDPVFTPDEAYLASGAASTCLASPRPSCKVNLAEAFVDAIELSPVTPVEKQNDDPERLSAPSAKHRAQKTREKIQFAALCWFVCLEGWNDGSNGPLLPRIQKVYGVGYAVVSLIFVFACLSNVILAERLGFGKNANSVGYVACIKENAEAKMSIFMAVYGAGALASPLVATQFSHLPQWNLHFLTSLGIAISNTIALSVVFRLKPQEECLAEIGIVDVNNSTSEHSHLRQIFVNKDVHFLAAFALLYVGAEVTVGGWIVTFIINARGGGSSSGYISTGFFGGLMVGRLVLIWFNEKIGERLALYIYAVLAIIFELVIWFVPSLVGDAVAVCVIGVLLGPMYPIAVNHARRVLPRWLLTGAIGWIAGVGQAGSAMVPFMVGAIAQKSGIQTLQPIDWDTESYDCVMGVSVPWFASS